MLRFAGARPEQEAGWIRFEGGQPLEPRTWRVPWHLLRPLLPGGGLHLSRLEITLRGVGLNPSRAGALRVLQRMGAELTIQEGELLSGEPSGDLTIRSGPLRGVEVEEGEIPSLIDEIPVLAIAACFAAGETRFRGAGELRVKESNRLEGLAARIRSLGRPRCRDDLLIRGGPLRGGAVSSGGDHRIAMAFAVAGLALRGGITLEDSGCVDVSFPTFFRCLEALGA